MKLTQFTLVWLGALVLVALSVLTVAARQDYRAVVIGTSLIDRGIPEEDQELSDLLGGAYIKHTHRGAKRAEMVQELSKAQKAGAQVVLIEISHFLYLQNHHANSSGWMAQGWGPLRKAGRDFLAYARVIGNEALAQIGIARRNVSHTLDRPHRVDAKNLKRLYPLHPAQVPEQADLVRAVAASQTAGTQVLFVATPYSELGLSLNGIEIFDEITQRAKTLSDVTGAPLFMPTGPWPDTFYNDSSHLNRAGRQRYRDLLIDWLRSALRDGTGNG